MAKNIYPHSVNDLFTAVGVGSLDRALTNNLYGINHSQIPGFLTSNRDQQGYVFMTRPQLNLQKHNLRNMRELYPLLTENPSSIGKAVRMMLDPRLGAGYTYKTMSGIGHIPPIYSPLVDNNNAFIPFVTNNTNSVSGWPDLVLPKSSSDPGLHKQVFTMADGIVRHFGEFELTFNIQNTMGDPASALFNTWLHYMGAVKEGRMDPYADYILNNRLDYNTRVYRLVLDQTREHVTKIFACIAGFPTSNPTGMFADMNRATPFSEQTKDISIRVSCTGFIAYDPLLIKNFNQVVQIFNSAMKDADREKNFKNINTRQYKRFLRIFNHRSYPRINPETMAMEWWVPNDTFYKYLNNTSSDLINMF